MGESHNQVSQYNVLYYIQTDRKISLSLSERVKELWSKTEIEDANAWGWLSTTNQNYSMERLCKQKGGQTAVWEGVCSFRRIPSAV